MEVFVFVWFCLPANSSGRGSAVITWIDFFNWRPDAFQVTVRVRYEPWRVMPDNIYAVGG